MYYEWIMKKTNSTKPLIIWHRLLWKAALVTWHPMYTLVFILPLCPLSKSNLAVFCHSCHCSWFSSLFCLIHIYTNMCFTNLVLSCNHRKASFSFYKVIPKTLKWLPYILICHCTSLSPWFIILDKNNFVKVFHHYWIPIWAPMLEWRSEGVFLMNILEKASQGPTNVHFFYINK